MALDRETDRIGRGVALAPAAPAFGGLERGEQSAADCGGAERLGLVHSALPGKESRAQAFLLADQSIQRIPGAFAAAVALLDGGDVEIDAGEILEQNRERIGRLENGEGFYVSAAAFARFHRTGAALAFGHQRYQLVVLAGGAKRTVEPVDRPLRGAARAAEIARPLDAAHFGESRPRAAQGTIAVEPARRRVAG